MRRSFPVNTAGHPPLNHACGRTQPAHPVNMEIVPLRQEQHWHRPTRRADGAPPAEGSIRRPRPAAVSMSRSVTTNPAKGAPDPPNSGTWHRASPRRPRRVVLRCEAGAKPTLRPARRAMLAGWPQPATSTADGGVDRPVRRRPCPTATLCAYILRSSLIGSSGMCACEPLVGSRESDLWARGQGWW
jgi:hypothetical protein